MPYFTVQTGLRGCYMPDTSYIVRCATRREFKACVADEARYWEGAAGLSERAIATFAATMWREAQKRNPAYLPHCLPVKPQGGDSYSQGIFASVATRAEYLSQEREG